MKLNWNFLGEGGGGGCKTKTFRGGSMDIFWNCTLQGSRGGERVEIERHASPAPTTPPPQKSHFFSSMMKVNQKWFSMV